MARTVNVQQRLLPCCISRISVQQYREKLTLNKVCYGRLEGRTNTITAFGVLTWLTLHCHSIWAGLTVSFQRFTIFILVKMPCTKLRWHKAWVTYCMCWSENHTMRWSHICWNHYHMPCCCLHRFLKQQNQGYVKSCFSKLWVCSDCSYKRKCIER